MKALFILFFGYYKFCTKELEKAQKKLAKAEPKEKKAPAKKACAKKAKKEE